MRYKLNITRTMERKAKAEIEIECEPDKLKNVVNNLLESGVLEFKENEIGIGNYHIKSESIPEEEINQEVTDLLNRIKEK